MARVLYWERILTEKIDEFRGKQFKVGDCDCGLFAADVVLALTGVDYMEQFRGKYKTPKGALKLLNKYADGTIEGYLNTIFKEHKTVALAKRGDVVTKVFDEEMGTSVGICCGDISGFIERDGGLIFVKTIMCDKAYEVS